MREVEKVFAYITRGEKLLVFTHPTAPEAGIQVPAGTVKADEPLTDAVLREAHEETGLSALRIARFLGETAYDMSAYGKHELHHRHFFHVLCEDATPEQWRHYEDDPSQVDDEMTRIPLDFFWMDLRQPMPALIAGHDQFIPELVKVLDSEE